MTLLFSPQNMTSDILPTPFVATYSSAYSGRPGYKAFDGGATSTTHWLANATTGWLQLDLGSGNAEVLEFYNIFISTSPEPATRAPKDWTVEGSDTGAFTGEEVLLDTVTGETGWTQGASRQFTCDVSTTAYRYFRITVTSNDGDASYLQIAEWEMYAPETIVEDPVISPTSGGYAATQQITITCTTTGATIYYTEDGSTPDATDTEYTGAFSLSTAKTVKAIGIKSGLDDSGIVSETYTIVTDFRYWRIYFSSGVSSSLSLGEIEMFDTLFGTDICSGGTASASSEAFGSVAANAFDGDPVTWWHASTTTDEWIEYDFGVGNEKNIIQASIICRDGQPSQAPKTFTVQASTDGIFWNDLWAETDITTWIDKLPFLFFKTVYSGDPISWRINTSAVDGGSEFALAEMVLKDTPGGTDLSIGGSAFASVYNATYTPSNAFDKNASTFYTGSSAPAWLLYMLSSPANIGEILLQARPSVPDQSPKDFTIESSIDNINWTVIESFIGETGWTSNEIRTFALTEIVEIPIILPTSGEYPASQLISMTCDTIGADIYYTIDGSPPDATDNLYSAPFALISAKTIKAIGIKTDFDDSAIVSETYTVAGAAVGDTLSSTNGDWVFHPSSYTYQWTRDAIDIPLATSSTYLTVSADAGTAVGCTVTAINSEGSTPVNSNTINVL